MKLSRKFQNETNKLVSLLQSAGVNFDKKVPVYEDGFCVYLTVKSSFCDLDIIDITNVLRDNGYNFQVDYSVTANAGEFHFWSLRFFDEYVDFLTYESVYGQLVIQF